IACIGVIGAGLALLGLPEREVKLPRERWPWGLGALGGLLLAFGEGYPVYLSRATLPGFNLFRVPARWLALFALGMALLAGMGLRLLLDAPPKLPRWLPIVLIAALVTLAGWSFVAQVAPEYIEGSATPTAITLVGWGLA